MKRIVLLAALLLVVAMNNAYAVPVTFNIDELYDWGRLYTYSPGPPATYTTTNSNPAFFGVPPDTPVGTAFPADTPGIADGKEDTWGAGNVASVKTVPANTVIWQEGASELTFMFYGFDDNLITKPNIVGTSTIQSIGGHILVYEDLANDFDGSLGTAGRTGLTTYTGATEGILRLDLVPVAINGFGTTLSSDFSFSTLSGSGAMYLNVSGLGTWDSLYDTNTQPFGADMSFTFTVRDNSISPTVSDWVVRGDAGGEANLVPEPTSMLMLGVGLAGIVVARRKKVV
jgi:hypothetical protein